MNESLLLLAFMVPGTLFLGAYQVLVRKTLRSPFPEGLLLGIVFFLSGVFLLGASYLIGFPEIEKGFWSAFIITVFLNIISQFIWIKAFKLEEASLISPLLLISPILVFLTGFAVLGEVPSLFGVFGVCITVVGLWFLLEAELTYQKMSLGALIRKPGILYGLSGIALFALAFPFDKKAVVFSSAILYSGFAIFLIGLFHLLWGSLVYRHSLATLTTLAWSLKRNIFFLLICNAVGIVLANHALNYSLVAYASSVKRLSPLWAVLFAGVFLHETNIQKKLIATLLMIVGVALTALAG